MIYLGYLDVYTSISKMFLDNRINDKKELEVNKLTFCIPSFVKNKKPLVNLEQFYNLMVQDNKNTNVVLNNIQETSACGVVLDSM